MNQKKKVGAAVPSYNVCKEILPMKNRRKLAVKVMKYVNAYTKWDFRIWTNGDSYAVATSLKNDKGQEMAIHYVMEKNGAQILVLTNACRCTTAFVQEKINAAGLGFPVYAKELKKSVIAIETPVTLKDLDKKMHVIAGGKMTAMIQIMTGIIHEKGE